MKNNYNLTLFSCFTGYVVQAIVNNFLPLLFITLQREYSLELSQITLLITVNFAVQLLTDIACAKFIDLIGYRASAITAHIFCAAGLIFLTFLPSLMPVPFSGLIICVVIYAVGGGMIEVLVSPVTEGCPTKNKEKAMSLLHSFYCFGHMGVVLISTLFFAVFSVEHWRMLAAFWAIIPIFNIFTFSICPINTPAQEGERSLKIRDLFKSGAFWVLFFMMLCAGASEQAVSQWASAFAEKGLNVSKTLGDILGPMAFALAMGLSRMFYAKKERGLQLDRFIILSLILCVLSYLAISLIPVPAIGLIACALCGFSVGILWPGTFSTAARTFKNGGTAMFALLALAGDIGCMTGPTLAGAVSNAAGGSLSTGLLSAIIFPLAMLVCAVFNLKHDGKELKIKS